MSNIDFLLNEASRCLLCKVPRCKDNCPIDTPIPEIIKLYKEGKLKEAGEVLFNNNPLSVICSLVCIHEDQCKGNCVRGIKGEPINFHDIEHEISKKYLEEISLSNVPKDKDRIAIVGGGPAGITISFILAMKGYKVTIFDAHVKIGGVLRYGIPEYRLPKKLIDTLEEKLVEIGVKIRPNTLIGPVISLDRLFEDGYKAVFIGTGVWNPKTLNIKGETLGNVHFAIDYLKSPEYYCLGDKVAVIGAGNVAMDAARSAKRNGAKEVTIIYRKGFEEMSATKQEIREAKEDNINFELFKSPIEITEEGVRLAVTENVIDSDGKMFTKTIEGKEEFFNCNSTIIAVSQTPRTNIVSNTTELNTNKWGLLITDDNGNTTKRGTFASGDVVTGAKTVVEAVVQAKRVAETIEKYCQNN
ncbi:NAD(P)-dependent oxidoreductase [Clostridium saccharoperbutylacetonicum]|uniref:NAD(P)-dependent oxidoreductase n=1 Tax=Clostridium saccharoperbutylacetonicum TaxID=36745 RepID=UPI000983A128|nr:NAD(P)-dependent oxidoreductase [Clostridium saccharoperbutylacetonicum]AQR95799.1 glutamate synthase [NADPH] small chain [Clostridium saccharoperbutylacetonicum]NSB31662.1 glutamate synthase (NADPH/NADH) small chain [Clostridium saccharoperbutylacetonicum]